MPTGRGKGSKGTRPTAQPNLQNKPGASGGPAGPRMSTGGNKPGASGGRRVKAKGYPGLRQNPHYGKMGY